MREQASGEERELVSWRDRLEKLDAELAEREAAAAAAADWTPDELAALAKERDALADQWDDLAEARDAAAVERDTSAEARETTAAGRDRRARALADDNDAGFADRFLSARDRDEAAADRSESRAERHYGASDRARASAERTRAAADRERADQRGEDAEREIAGLQAALESRHSIGLAQGIFMERYDIDVERAFQMLVALSAQTDRTLSEIADVIATSERRGLDQTALAAPARAPRARDGSR